MKERVLQRKRKGVPKEKRGGQGEQERGRKR